MRGLGQRRPLLLAAGEVVGVLAQEGAQLAELCRLGHFFLPLFFQQILVRQHLIEVQLHRLLHKKGLGILGQNPQLLSLQAHLPPVGGVHPGDEGEGGGLARAVAAHHGKKGPGGNGEAQAPSPRRARPCRSGTTPPPAPRREGASGVVTGRSGTGARGWPARERKRSYFGRYTPAQVTTWYFTLALTSFQRVAEAPAVICCFCILALLHDSPPDVVHFPTSGGFCLFFTFTGAVQ